MFRKYSEKFKKIEKILQGIQRDVDNGVVKDASSINSPVVFNSNDFQSDIAMARSTPIDPFSKKKEDVERRDNVLAYYEAIFSAFDGRDFEQKPYFKEDSKNV